MSYQEEVEKDQCPLRDALSHIARTCSQSREQSRRIRWIKQRADWALKGKKYDADAFDLPRSAGNTASLAKAKAASMKSEKDEALAQLADAAEVMRSVRQDLTDSGSISQIDAFLAKFSSCEVARHEQAQTE